jgi:hypothetical protein
MQYEDGAGHRRRCCGAAKPARRVSSTGAGVQAGPIHDSTPLLLEYEAVCQREEHRLAAGLTRNDVDSFLDGLAGLSEPVTVHFLWRPQLRDAADEMVLEAAVNGQAQAIVAFNHRDYGNAPPRFGILLLLPAEAYRRIEA